MSPDAAVSYRTLSPARTLTGTSGDALQNRNPDPFPDGALCFVAEERALYRLAKFSTEAVSSPEVIATANGAGAPGRWVQVTSQGATAPLSALFWCDSRYTGLANGSISAPFPTLQEGIDTIGADGGSIICVPGEYEGAWVVPAGKIVNIYGAAGAQGVADGNVEFEGPGTLHTGAGVRLENVALGDDISMHGSGTLYCYNVSFYLHELVQVGAGGWTLKIGSDILEQGDAGPIACNSLLAQNTTFQRPITIASGSFALFLTCVVQQDVTFVGAPGTIAADLYTLNTARTNGALFVNATVTAVDAPTVHTTIASPVFGAAGIQTVAISYPGARVGDTFVISNETALPAGVALGQPMCTSDNDVDVVLFALGAAAGGNVDVAITRINGGV